jgi:hypothetical protein
LSAIPGLQVLGFIELAHAVSRKSPPNSLAFPSPGSRIAPLNGVLGVSNFSLEGDCQELLVRRTRDDR